MIKNLNIFFKQKIELDKKRVHKIISELKKELKFKIDSLEINFLSSDEVLDLNKKYLNHHYNTDIITFNYTGNNENLNGEILISIEDAMNNARKYSIKINEEFLRLIVHGILHLLGYDDIKRSEKIKMKKLEDSLVKKFCYLI